MYYVHLRLICVQTLQCSRSVQCSQAHAATLIILAWRLLMQCHLRAWTSLMYNNILQIEVVWNFRKRPNFSRNGGYNLLHICRVNKNVNAAKSLHVRLLNSLHTTSTMYKMLQYSLNKAVEIPPLCSIQQKGKRWKGTQDVHSCS